MDIKYIEIIYIIAELNLFLIILSVNYMLKKLNEFFNLFIILNIIFIINKLFFYKKNFLVSETGDRHQKFVSEKSSSDRRNFFILKFSFFIHDQVLSFILFSFLILLLGIFSDCKHM